MEPETVYRKFSSLAEMINNDLASDSEMMDTIGDIYYSHEALLNQDSIMLRILLDLCDPQNGAFVVNMTVQDRRRLLTLRKKLKENIEILERPKWLQCDPKTVLPGLNSSKRIAL
jgi:hypothetical protein